MSDNGGGAFKVFTMDDDEHKSQAGIPTLYWIRRPKLHQHRDGTLMPELKRRRVQRSPSPTYKLDDQDEQTYEPYIPVAQRQQAKLARLSAWTAKPVATKSAEEQAKEDAVERQAQEKEEDARREKQRKERTLLLEAQEVHSKKAAQGLRHIL